MSEGGGNKSDDSMNNRSNKDWEMVSLTSSTCADGSNGVYTKVLEDLDSDTFIFPPSRHEGLPIESDDHEGIENPLLGSDNLSDNNAENEEEDPLGGPEFESPMAEEENSRNLDVLRDSDASGEGIRDLAVDENVELKHKGLDNEGFGNEGWMDEGFGDEDFRCDGWWKHQTASLT